MRAQITKTVSIDNQEILDVIITALEGGSNYWYFLRDRYADILSSLEAMLLRWDETSCFKVYDIEDEDTILGYVNIHSIQRGLEFYLEDYEWDEDMDAEYADTFFQLVVMGDIVFG